MKESGGIHISYASLKQYIMLHSEVRIQSTSSHSSHLCYLYQNPSDTDYVLKANNRWFIFNLCISTSSETCISATFVGTKIFDVLEYTHCLKTMPQNHHIAFNSTQSLSIVFLSLALFLRTGCERQYFWYEYGR